MASCTQKVIQTNLTPWGVPFCWVIDPEKQTGWQYHAGSDPERSDHGGVLVAGDLSVPLAQLFSDKT
jgi:hypothetical protein